MRGSATVAHEDAVREQNRRPGASVPAREAPPHHARGREVSHFWERGGRCPARWSFRRYALPEGVPATGGSYLSCRRGKARVFWAEAGE
jgi:hypothetical protein